MDEFRKLSASLAITEAARRRLFFEQQLQAGERQATQAEDAMTKTEQSTGVLQIDSQARSLIESAAFCAPRSWPSRFRLTPCGLLRPTTIPTLFWPNNNWRLYSRSWNASQDRRGSGFRHQSFERKGDAVGDGISPHIANSSTRRPSSSYWRRNSKSPNSMKPVKDRLFRWWMRRCLPIRRSSPHRPIDSSECDDRCFHYVDIPGCGCGTVGRCFRAAGEQSAPAIDPRAMERKPKAA